MMQFIVMASLNQKLDNLVANIPVTLGKLFAVGGIILIGLAIYGLIRVLGGGAQGGSRWTIWRALGCGFVGGILLFGGWNAVVSFFQGSQATIDELMGSTSLHPIFMK